MLEIFLLLMSSGVQTAAGESSASAAALATAEAPAEIVAPAFPAPAEAPEVAQTPPANAGGNTSSEDMGETAAVSERTATSTSEQFAIVLPEASPEVTFDTTAELGLPIFPGSPAEKLPTVAAHPAPEPAPETPAAPATGFAILGAKPVEPAPETTAPETTAQAPAFLAPKAPEADAGLTAEPQIASGRFLTALEVKPILNATKGNWVAVREYAGQDLVYVTHVWAWRCGLAQLKVGINGAAPEVWPLPECHTNLPAANSVLPEDGDPYRGFPLRSVQQIEIQLTYDDLSVETGRFNRRGALIP
jgi:hypothetical protein